VHISFAVVSGLTGSVLAAARIRPGRPGFIRSISESLTTATGLNVTGLYDRVQANEEFDRKTDVVDGFTRVTDANFDEVVCPFRNIAGRSVEC
jgi:hypothetical protein